MFLGIGCIIIGIIILLAYMDDANSNNSNGKEYFDDLVNNYLSE